MAEVDACTAQLEEILQEESQAGNLATPDHSATKFARLRIRHVKALLELAKANLEIAKYLQKA